MGPDTTSCSVFVKSKNDQELVEAYENVNKFQSELAQLMKFVLSYKYIRIANMAATYQVDRNIKAWLKRLFNNEKHLVLSKSCTCLLRKLASSDDQRLVQYLALEPSLVSRKCQAKDNDEDKHTNDRPPSSERVAFLPRHWHVHTKKTTYQVQWNQD